MESCSPPHCIILSVVDELAFSSPLLSLFGSLLVFCFLVFSFPSLRLPSFIRLFRLSWSFPLAVAHSARILCAFVLVLLAFSLLTRRLSFFIIQQGHAFIIQSPSLEPLSFFFFLSFLLITCLDSGLAPLFLLSFFFISLLSMSGFVLSLSHTPELSKTTPTKENKRSQKAERCSMQDENVRCTLYLFFIFCVFCQSGFCRPVFCQIVGLSFQFTLYFSNYLLVLSFLLSLHLFFHHKWPQLFLF